MHGGRPLLGGPVFWFITGLLFVAGMMAVFILLDIWRAKRTARQEQLPENRWVYVVPQALYLLALFVAQTPVVPASTSAIMVFATPFIIAEQFAYLLRVVFPKPESAPAEATGTDSWDQDAEELAETPGPGDDSPWPGDELPTRHE